MIEEKPRQQRTVVAAVAAVIVLIWLLGALGSAPAHAYTTVNIDAGRGPVTVYVPGSYTPGSRIPLLLLLHGYSSTGPSVESWIGYLPLVDARGFAYAFPNGRIDAVGNRFWTATDACCNLFNQGGLDDDSIYLRALIERIRDAIDIDASRIWVAGHSNGGFMAHRMACDHSEIVAGIVSLAGATWADPARCPTREPVHVLEIHGTSDNVIQYNGGTISGHAYPGAVTTSQTWATKNGCDPSLVVTITGALDLVSGSSFETDILRRAAGCDLEGSSELWRMNGAPHSPTLTASFKQATIDFLFAHPKQAVRFIDGETMRWQAVPEADRYDIYRGLLPLTDGNGDGAPDGGYGACVAALDPDTSDTTFPDAARPSPGSGFFYTVAYVDSGFAKHGGIGSTSAGMRRALPTPCP